MPSKHDVYLFQLAKIVEKDHEILGTNITLKNFKRSVAEIDLLAQQDGFTDIYEVKCSHRIHKAQKQLKRIKRILDLEKCRLYFYCGSSGKLELVKT